MFLSDTPHGDIMKYMLSSGTIVRIGKIMIKI